MEPVLRRIATARVVTCPASTPVLEVARVMREEHVGDVVLLDEEVPIGILTDRDIVVGVLAQDPEDLHRLVASDVALMPLVVVEDTRSVEEVVDLMVEEGVRRLPVVGGNGDLVGIVTMDDLTHHLSDLARRLSGIPSVQLLHERRQRSASR